MTVNSIETTTALPLPLKLSIHCESESCQGAKVSWGAPQLLLGLQGRNRKWITVEWLRTARETITRGAGCVRKAWKPLSLRPILPHVNFWSKPSLIIDIIFCRYPHSPNKLIATKYCFLLVRDDTSFVFFINYFLFLCSVVLHYFIDFAIINLYKKYFIIIILFINNFFIKNILIFFVSKWSVFGVVSTPDKVKVEECKQCTRLAAKCDHEALSLYWVCYLKLEINPRDGPNCFWSVTFEKA